MKTLIIYLVVTAVTLPFGLAQDARRRIGDPAPSKGSSRLYITPMPGQVANSLKSLCDASSLIVDATVKAALPARETSPQALETDFVFVIHSTLKGAVTGPIIVSQRGGATEELTVTPTQYSLMKPGERHLLFLTEDRRPGIPDVAGSRRYLVTGIWSGLFRFENGYMHRGAGTPDALLSKYEGLTVEQITSEVRNLLKP